MALDETKFSHISVTADDEDDEVVIQAGVRPPKIPQPDSQPEETVDATPADTSDSKDRPAQENAAQAADASQGPTTSKKRTPKDDTYHETTLDDIKNSKMSIMQRVIIIALAVFIVVFAVYYILNYC